MAATASSPDSVPTAFRAHGRPGTIRRRRRRHVLPATRIDYDGLFQSSLSDTGLPPVPVRKEQSGPPCPGCGRPLVEESFRRFSQGIWQDVTMRRCTGQISRRLPPLHACRFVEYLRVEPIDPPADVPPPVPVAIPKSIAEEPTRRRPTRRRAKARTRRPSRKAESQAVPQPRRSLVRNLVKAVFRFLIRLTG